jgi:hypothetical protein
MRSVGGADRRSARGVAVALVAMVVLLAASPVAGADDAPRKLRDKLWAWPDSGAFAIHAVAMLPPASFDRNPQSEKLADQQLGVVLRGSGHRWLSSTSAKALIGAGPGGDSLLKATSDAILARGRPDSIAVPGLCRRTRTGALLSLRVDRWEQLTLEFNQAGKPSTTISLSASLVDSTGRLLWTISGSETAEGPYHDPSANVLGVKTSGLGTQPITGQGGAPAYAEVLTTIFTRWKDRFPARRAAP